MNKIISLFLINIISCAVALAQVPQAFNYTGIAYDSKGKEIRNQDISVLAEILDGSAEGPSIFSEVHYVTTDNKGFFSIQVGGADNSLPEGSLGGIEWGDAPKWLAISIDAKGATGFQLVGSVQLLSVPYALYAESASAVSGSDGYFADGGEEAGADRRLGNTNDFGLSIITDDSARLHVTNEGNVGVGTLDPDGKFEVARDQAVSTITATTYRPAAFTAGKFIGRGARGTKEEPQPVQEHDWLATYNANGYGSTGFSFYSRARIGMLAAEDWTDADQGTYMIFATTPSGGTQVTERMRITDEGQVGIGTTDPSHNLEVVADQRTSAITSTTYRESGFTGSQFLARSARGTQDDPQPLRENDYLASFNARGYGNSGFSNFPRARMGMRAAEDWTDESQGANILFSTTPAGTTQLYERMRITDEGKVGIGTEDPDGRFELATDDDASIIIASTYRSSFFVAGMFMGRGARGTQEDPQPVQAGDYLATFNGSGYGSTGFSNRSRARVSMRAAEDWTDFSQGAFITFVTTPNGTTDRTEQMRISDVGDVGIGTTDPKSKLHVDGGIQVANDFDPATPDKVGTLRYRAEFNASFVEMCMQVGPGAYAWVSIKQFSW